MWKGKRCSIEENSNPNYYTPTGFRTQDIYDDAIADVVDELKKMLQDAWDGMVYWKTHNNPALAQSFRDMQSAYMGAIDFFRKENDAKDN